MFSSDDFERFYFLYQTDALPKGLSIQSFCSKNKVPYNLFSKWYKDTRKQVIEVKVEGRPTEDVETPVVSQVQRVVSDSTSSATRIWLELRMSNGLHLSQKNLSYQELVRMIEKLEGLC